MKKLETAHAIRGGSNTWSGFAGSSAVAIILVAWLGCGANKPALFRYCPEYPPELREYLLTLPPGHPDSEWHKRFAIDCWGEEIENIELAPESRPWWKFW